jgi:signal transduction histidine kinase
MQMEFAASVSHELRTPLSVLCSAVDNIADGVVSGKEQLAKYASVLRNQSQQINALVSQVLLFASTQDGKSHYVMRPTDVSHVIDSAVLGTAELVRKAGFAMEQKIAPALPPVMGDPAALSQCLQNLITNALKYGQKGRWIAIHATCEESKDHRQKEVRIDVHDRGEGIDRGEMQRIFEPFYRSPAVVSKQIHGTGLALPIAKSLAEAMGGRLSVTSEVGVGTVFTLRVPAFDDTNGTERKGRTRV